jgi:membrane protease YdiL (CAAX protease family)
MLFVMLAVLFPIRAATFGYRRLTAADEADVPRVRMWLYRQIILIQWSLVLLVALLWAVLRRPWSAIGLKPEVSPELIGVFAGLVIVVALAALQQRGRRNREEAYARVRARARHIERMLPHDERELRWFSAVGVTAGICEELLYRGYLIWYLQHWLPLTFAVTVAVVIFGFGHFYQGARGMLLTAIVGAFLAVVYLVTGTLFASMAIHALMDLYSGYAVWRAYRKPAA